MGYEGGSLTSLFGEGPQAATDVAVMRMAEKGGDRMTELTVENTPIGGREGEGHGGGNLRSSWYTLPLERVHIGSWPGWRSGTASDVDYAPHVEYGTGLWGPQGRKYEIRPKNPGGVLRWIDPKTGHEVFARRVWHPGSPGQHMLGIAATVVEGEADSGLFDGILNDWARTVEASAD